MTPTEKQKLISEQAIYGDLMGANDILGLTKLSFMYIIDDVNLLPILRPLDLTKEITHNGYNENQPFIPLIEIAKTVEPKLRWSLETDKIGAYAFARENGYPHYIRPQQLECCSIDIYDLLNSWHFDTRNLLDLNEAISTDEVNPYEV